MGRGFLAEMLVGARDRPIAVLFDGEDLVYLARSLGIQSWAQVLHAEMIRLQRELTSARTHFCYDRENLVS